MHKCCLRQLQAPAEPRYVWAHTQAAIPACWLPSIWSCSSAGRRCYPQPALKTAENAIDSPFFQVHSRAEWRCRRGSCLERPCCQDVVSRFAKINTPFALPPSCAQRSATSLSEYSKLIGAVCCPACLGLGRTLHVRLIESSSRACARYLDIIEIPHSSLGVLSCKRMH